MKKVKVDKPEEVDMFTLASLWPRDTGLPVAIWIEERSDTPKDKQGPKIRVMTHPGKINFQETVVVTLEEPPRLTGHLNTKYFNKVKEFIASNRKSLMDYWNRKIDIAEFARKFKKVK